MIMVLISGTCVVCTSKMMASVRTKASRATQVVCWDVGIQPVQFKCTNMVILNCPVETSLLPYTKRKKTMSQPEALLGKE